jgi:hypothetical protein
MIYSRFQSSLSDMHRQLSAVLPTAVVLGLGFLLTMTITFCVMNIARPFNDAQLSLF